MSVNDNKNEYVVRSYNGEYNPYTFRAALPNLNLDDVELVATGEEGYIVKLSNISKDDVSRIIFIHTDHLEII